MNMSYMGISFPMYNKTHINQLEPLDRLLAYISRDDGIFYEQEHGEIFEDEFHNCGGLTNLLNMLKASNYINDIPNAGIWYLTDTGVKYIRQIAFDRHLDPTTVYFRHDEKLHAEAKEIIHKTKNISINYFWLFLFG